MKNGSHAPFRLHGPAEFKEQIKVPESGDLVLTDAMKQMTALRAAKKAKDEEKS